MKLDQVDKTNINDKVSFNTFPNDEDMPDKAEKNTFILGNMFSNEILKFRIPAGIKFVRKFNLKLQFKATDSSVSSNFGYLSCNIESKNHISHVLLMDAKGDEVETDRECDWKALTKRCQEIYDEPMKKYNWNYIPKKKFLHSESTMLSDVTEFDELSFRFESKHKHQV
jgi:hypothetical protein